MIWEKELLRLLEQTKEKIEESPEGFTEWFFSLPQVWQGHVYRQLLPRSRGFIPDPEVWVDEAVQAIKKLTPKQRVIKFITIDDEIISASLSDLQVLSYPGSSLISFPQHKNDIPGQFVLRVNRLDYLERTYLIPDDPFHGSFTRSFTMAIYEGLPGDRSTWKEVTNFGGCIFDISADRDEWIRFQKEQVSPLKPEGEPVLYYLSGRYREYRSAYACWDGFDNPESVHAPAIQRQKDSLLDFDSRGEAPTFWKPDGPKDNYEYLP